MIKCNTILLLALLLLFSSCGINKSPDIPVAESSSASSISQISGSEAAEDLNSDFSSEPHISSGEPAESENAGHAQNSQTPEKGSHIYDYIELIDRQTGELNAVREGDVFDGFKITEIQHSQYNDSGESDGWYTNRFIVTYEKEITLRGTLGCNMNMPGSVYLEISEEELQIFPQDINGITALAADFFYVEKPEEIVEVLGEDFSVECEVVVSRTTIMYIDSTSATSTIKVVAYNILN